jgi:ATP-dependent Lhr-like helicase
VEPGLWIAAEHGREYAAALAEGDIEARMHVVRRLLRYRGAHSGERVAERYLWPEQTAEDVLESLRKTGGAVEYEGLWYHAALFDRARRETVVMRRRQVDTLPGERYASMIASRVRENAPPKDALVAALSKLSGQPYSPELWEGALLPARVNAYRPELLDSVLAQGGLFWRFTPERLLEFHPYDDIDWDAEPIADEIVLEGEEKAVYEALVKRGASFSQRLSGLFGGVSPHAALMGLAEKGLASADSFVPVRQWIDREKIESGPVRRRAKSHVMTLTSGRWEIVRPMKDATAEQRLERAFGRTPLLCRETAQGLDWGEALRLLRVWEYTGRVRRGYFIEGMSGMQYIRESDYAGVMLALERPDGRAVWLPAADPAQPWGKCLAHRQGRAFMAVPGTAVALRGGLPVAVFERQGSALRIFDGDSLPETLAVFAQDFAARRIYPSLRRLTVKQYPGEAAEALNHAGFIPEMRDFVLYRGLNG